MERGTARLTLITALAMLIGVFCSAQSQTDISSEAGEHLRQLPPGTAIRMSLGATVSGNSLRGETFSGVVSAPVLLDGRTAIPAGTEISGRIAKVSNRRRIAGGSSLDLRPEYLILANGTKLRISASFVDTGWPDRFAVDDEGRIHTKNANSDFSKREALIGTGAGAGLGALIGGLPGAAIGAGVGAGATTTHWLLNRGYGQIPAGTLLILELTRPLAI